MMSSRKLLVKNIKAIILAETSPQRFYAGEAMSRLPIQEDGFILAEKGRIIDFGPMTRCPDSQVDEEVDATGRYVLPTWVDSHTHLVFPKWRDMEFVEKIKGADYETIARKGGGIQQSAKMLQQTSEAELVAGALTRIREIMGYGTGAVEIKSGYGLTVESELKMLRVIKKLKAISPIPVRATFLGAHTIPARYKTHRAGYIREIIEEMLPAIAEEGLAEYIDVFCEKVAFSVAETDKILAAGRKYGLIPKVHTNQFTCMGGIEVSLKHEALSVDHLEVITDEEIAALRQKETIATLLPSAPFFLNDNYPEARKLIAANIPVALATDYNPGSSPSGKMPFVLSLASIKMKMMPLEAIAAATINGAAALNLEHELGSIAVGKRASFIITKPVQSIDYLPYAFGGGWIERVIFG